LGSLTAANWVSFDFNVSYSSCWGYSLINTLFKKKYTYIYISARPPCISTSGQKKTHASQIGCRVAPFRIYWACLTTVECPCLGLYVREMPGFLSPLLLLLLSFTYSSAALNQFAKCLICMRWEDHLGFCLISKCPLGRWSKALRFTLTALSRGSPGLVWCSDAYVWAWFTGPNLIVLQFCTVSNKNTSWRPANLLTLFQSWQSVMQFKTWGAKPFKLWWQYVSASQKSVSAPCIDFLHCDSPQHCPWRACTSAHKRLLLARPGAAGLYFFICSVVVLQWGPATCAASLLWVLQSNGISRKKNMTGNNIFNKFPWACFWCNFSCLSTALLIDSMRLRKGFL